MLLGHNVWRSAVRNLCNSLRQSRGRRLRKRRSFAGATSWVVAAEVMEPRELLTAGVIDTSFGQNGTVNMPSPEFGDPHSYYSVVQANGEIVTVGNVASDRYHYGYDALIARFTTSGALDKTFGKNGDTTVSFGQYSQFVPNGMLQEANGKFLVYGAYEINLLYNITRNGVVLQFNANGTLDKTFGSNGELIITGASLPNGILSAFVMGAAQDPQGRFVMKVENPAAVGKGVYLMRINANGTPDSAFGPSGYLPTNFASDFNSISVVSAPSDPAGYEILMAGSSYGGAANSQTIYWFVERLSSSGTPDPSFGTNGIATVDLPLDPTQYVANQIYSANLRGLNIDSSGRIYLNGFEQISSFDPLTGQQGPPVHIDPAAARLTAGGALDATYANGGVSLTPIALQISNEDMATAIDSQGRIVVIMTATQSSTTKIGVMLRYTADGAIDTTFGTAGTGYVFLNAWSSDARMYNGISVAPDGKLIVIGLSFVSRYLEV